MMTCWSWRRDLNPRLQPWQGCTLPLSYSRVLRTDVFYKRSRTLSSQKTACGKFSEDFHVRGKGFVFRSGRSRARLMPRVRAADQKRPRQKRSLDAAGRKMQRTPEGRPAGGAGEPGRGNSAGGSSTGAPVRGGRRCARGADALLCAALGMAALPHFCGAAGFTNGAPGTSAERVPLRLVTGRFSCLFIPEIACAPGFLLQMTFFH